MNEYYYPYHEAHKGIEQSIFGHIYSSAKPCPSALIQIFAWIFAWSMVLHSITNASRSCLRLLGCWSSSTFQILCFKYPQRKKSHTVRSGERSGHGQSPCLLITLPGNCMPTKVSYRRIAGMPSCLHTVFLSMP